MSQPSNWPLPAGSSRLILPQPLLQELQKHPLSKDLYPIAYGHYIDATGHRVRRNVHTDYLIIFCHGGRGRYRVGRDHGYLVPGQVLVLPKGRSHTYQSDSNQPWSIYWAHFDGERVSQFMDYLGFPVTQSNSSKPVITLRNWRPLLSDVTQLLNLQHERLTLDRGILASSLLRKLISEIPMLAKRELPQKNEFNLTTLDRYMRDNSHKSLLLEELAEFAGLSKFHFSKRFRHETGVAPLQYFTRMKVEQAAQMLLEGNYTIRQVSQTFGFDDPYYFSRLFKKHCGLSPQHYRNKQKNGAQQSKTNEKGNAKLKQGGLL